jgi:predicted DsbA family dithiol-disulfide isomerase
MSNEKILTVDIVSDVICPWCFVGKRRLERALKAIPGGKTARVRWLPFQLNPQMPPAGMNRREYRSAKFGSWQKAQELDAQVAAVAATEGIAFAHDRIERTPNTLDAHRLIALAAKEGIQDAIVEALFRGYFTEGRDISDRAVLLDVVALAGLDRSRAEAFLNAEGGAGDIHQEEAEARRLGVSGVPFFVINGEVGMSGARSVAEFLAAFEQAAEPHDSAEGGTCRLDPAGGRPTC